MMFFLNSFMGFRPESLVGLREYDDLKLHLRRACGIQ